MAQHEMGAPQRSLRQDLMVLLVLLGLAILFFWQVTLGSKTMLPADNVFAWQPWKTYAPQMGATVPHNNLLSDLYIENYAWKRLILDALRARQLPLWNPYLFGGVPFLAAGQHSALYPPSVLFYILPLPAAYGWFAALHLFLGGAFVYYLARTLRVRRIGAAIASIVFMFSGFTITHNVFPMIIAAIVWLPLILACIERIVRRAGRSAAAGNTAAPERDETPVPSPWWAYLPDLLLGTLAYGMVFLAGHPEMYYYVALVSGAYALWRLVGLAWQRPGWRRLGGVVLALAVMVAVGVGLGSMQWLPLLELVRYNFREGSVTFQDVLGWAYPKRQILAMFIPDLFGNPAHHSYFDLFQFKTVPVTSNAAGGLTDNTFWGIKNYVEGASYVGFLPLVLALLAILRRHGKHLWFFIGLAALSILFVYGSPLYILVYKLPGLSQVHSPFRWIMPYTLCMAILAGMGADALTQGMPAGEVTRGGMARVRRWATWLANTLVPWGTLVAGGGLLLGLAGSFLLRQRLVARFWSFLMRDPKAAEGLMDGRMAFSYEFRNVLILAVAVFLSGLVLVLRPRMKRAALWGMLVGLVILGELFVIGYSFFPATDPKLVEYRTPAIDFLKKDPDLYRITSLVGGDEKTFNANAGMLYGIADVRGYDSIIPRQYAEMMRLIQEQGELLYNRIAPIFENHTEALNAPLLNMLNTKYVLTDKQRAITNPGYTLVYDGEIRIYRNDQALPRAFLVSQAQVIPDAQARAHVLQSFDPRQVLILEEQPQGPGGGSGQVERVDYGLNEVSVALNAAGPCFLVLGDSYFPGWVAFIRPTDAPDPNQAEEKVTIYRANGNFRAVQVPAGRSVVRFKYSPNLVKYGFYGSFIAGVLWALGVLGWLWLRFSRPSEAQTATQRVTKNSVAPIVLSLINKVIDMAFAMLMLRLLGPVAAGQFYYAVVVISWFDIITNFGLNTLLTREVAKDKEHANRYLSNTTLLRLLLCAASVPVLGIFFLLRRLSGPLEPATVLAIALFALGLVPSNISAGISAAFNAYERMELPAFVTTLTTVLKVSLGAVALLLGTSYVGLAAVSIVVNLITMLVLYVLLRRMLFRPSLEADWGFQKQMLLASYPLMLNHLLATLFFKVAVLLLERLSPDPRVLGYYSTAYKYIDAVGVIPAYFTMAIFPLMSRYAAAARDTLLRAYRLAIKVLLIVAVPGALVMSSLSHELITILGGSAYLPYAADILQVMIWYMPLGFINSVTQYVLIALDQQRFLTRAFAIGLAFSVLANWVLIVRFGFMAAAYVAVASELVLLIPFYIGVRRHLARIPWVQLAWKIVVSALPMAAMFVIFQHRHRLLTLAIGTALYLLGLWLLRVFDSDEQQAVGQVLPWRRVGARVLAYLRG